MVLGSLDRGRIIMNGAARATPGGGGEDIERLRAVGLAADGVHDHEIWFVPDRGGDLVSLGVVTPGRVVAHDVPERVARALREGSQLVLTREPLGGKPPDTAAGPVVAEARFTTI